MPAFVALPERLTSIPPEPTEPAAIAVDATGQPSITHEQMVAWFEAWRAYGRTLADKLRAIASVQPATIPE